MRFLTSAAREMGSLVTAGRDLPKESGLIRFGLVLGGFSGTCPRCQKAVSEVRVSKVAGLTQQ